MLTTRQYAVIVSCFGQLQHVGLCYNRLTRLDVLPDLVQLSDTLESVQLTGNEFESLDSLQALTRLDRLKRLDIRRNRIKHVSSDPDRRPVFPASLTDVNLSHNAIASWSVIDSLPTVFPGLRSLNANGNPAYAAGSADDGFVLTIARLGQLETLNYTTVTPTDRFNAETFYLSLIGREVSAAQESDEGRIVGQHPRWTELCGKYSRPVIRRASAAAGPGGGSVAAELGFLTVRVPGQPEFSLEVPIDTPVYALVALVARRAGIEPRLARLVWETGELAGGDTWHTEGTDGGDGDDDDERAEGAAGCRVPSRFREVVVEPSMRPIEAAIPSVRAGAAVRVERVESAGCD